jgi:hydroxyacyl-ACP dehydratase HTD2-like protein with hotdog domain
MAASRVSGLQDGLAMTTQTVIAAEVRQQAEAVAGRRRETEDSLAPEAAEKLAALFGQDPPGDVLPPTWHWAYFNRGIPLEDQGPDLHERTGLFLPAVPYPRRMWAAGEVAMLQPLRLGEPARRTSTVASVVFKDGKAGGLCFVTLKHQVEQASVPCIEETQVIVYREIGPSEPALRQAKDPVPKGYFVHAESQLFFYSCITHNGHRIHWDRDYCREVEGYPDLVVHGPLMATELCDAMRDGPRPMRFSYRALAPVFVTTPVRIQMGVPGGERSGSIERSDGVVSMAATMSVL